MSKSRTRGAKRPRFRHAARRCLVARLAGIRAAEISRRARARLDYLTWHRSHASTLAEIGRRP